MADTTAVGQQPLCVLQRLQPVLVVTAWTLLRQASALCPTCHARRSYVKSSSIQLFHIVHLSIPDDRSHPRAKQVLRSVVLQTLHIAVHVAHLLASPVLPVLRAHQSQLRLPRRTPGDALLQRYLHHQQARMQQTAVSPRAPPQQAAGRRSWPLSVVLDLDETLVWCRRPSEDGSQPAVPLSRGSFEVECELSSGRRGCLTVVKRPGVTEFLHRVSAFADITVFTASTPGIEGFESSLCNCSTFAGQHCSLYCMQMLTRSTRHCASLHWLPAGYAQPVLDALDPTGQLFAACLFRNSTSKTRHHENVKVSASRTCTWPLCRHDMTSGAASQQTCTSMLCSPSTEKNCLSLHCNPAC